MRRRDFVLGAVGGVGALGVAKSAVAGGECYEQQCGPGYCVQTCTAGIPSNYMQFIAAQQRGMMWCWAACIQMVFGTFGFAVPQEQFVLQTFGTIVDKPGSHQAILAAVNRTYMDTGGRIFTAIGTNLRVNVGTAIADLAANCPLILCYNTGGQVGHATVLTGLTYTVDRVGRFQLNEAIVRDPWPGSPSRRVLNAAEWNGMIMLARVRCV